MTHGQQGYTVAQPSETKPGQDRNMEVISLKLDSLRTSVDSLNQRLANIEQMLRSRRNW